MRTPANRPLLPYNRPVVSGLFSTICLAAGLLVGVVLALPDRMRPFILRSERVARIAFFSPALAAAFLSGFGASGVFVPPSATHPFLNFLRSLTAGALVTGFVYAAERLVHPGAVETGSAGDEANLDLPGSRLRERLEDEAAKKQADVGAHLGRGDGANG